MRYLVSLLVCTSLFLSGCIIGRNPLSESINPQISKTSQKAAPVRPKSGKGPGPRLVVSEGPRQIGPAGASSSETAQWDRF
jgi:hypothetical protein